MNLNMLNKDLLGSIRQRIGANDEHDDSRDKDIKGMTARDALDAYLTWNGIIGYTTDIWNAVQTLMAAESMSADRLMAISKSKVPQSSADDEWRRARLIELNHHPESRQVLEKRYGQVWDSDELGKEFTILAFLAPLVVVKRKSNGVLGSLEFQHDPRFYFSWREDRR